MARSSMADLITSLRGFANAGTADFTLGTVSYWTDDQLQAALDRAAINLYEVEIIPQPLYSTGGSVEYKIYTTPQTWLESTDSGGSARFIVSNGIGSILGTSQWTADYQNGIVTFGTDQQGSARYITGHSYDIYAAAADVWQQKAAAAAAYIDFSTDNHSVKRSNTINAYLSMAKMYAGMATSGPASASSADMVRGDQRPSYGRDHE